MTPLPFFTPDPDGLDDGPEPEWETASLAEALEHHVSRIRRYRGLLADLEAERDRMVARYTQWAETKAKPLLDRIQWSEDSAKGLVAAQVDAHPKGPKVFNLPSGVVRSNAPRPSVIVEDFKAYEDWASSQDRPNDWASWSCKPDKDAIKRLAVKDEVAVTAEGEVVPGVRVDPGQRSVTVTPGGDE